MSHQRAVAVAIALAAASPATAAETLRLGPARLTVGGEASLTAAPDEDGYFNHTSYRLSSVRRARLALSAMLQAGERVAVLGEVRSDNLDRPRAYALYLRLRPWPQRAIDVQAGMVPPVFGAFGRRRYGPDNPLIGYPLAYQYLTTMRSNAAPASADELLSWRGEGWLLRYSVGEPGWAPGLPLVDADRWDTGVQARVGSQPLQVAVAVSQGTLSHPRVSDDNDGKQVSARIGWEPSTGLLLGASFARGAYATRELAAVATSGGTLRQQTWGADAEYSRDYWVVRAEAVAASWDVAALREPLLGSPVRALGLMAEGRYRLRPGLHVAARADRLGFSRLRGSAGRLPWDAPVTRLEVGVGWSPLRNVVLKAGYQHNRRDGGRVPRERLPVVQLLAWF